MMTTALHSTAAHPPTWVSLTGADDQTDIGALLALDRRFPKVEWALLYFPEREGTARNPSTHWRQAFLARRPTRTAAHLCGQTVFRDLLEDTLANKRLTELAAYNRVQVNINARHVDFSEDEVLGVYQRLSSAGLTLILQYHETSAPVIERFLRESSPAVRQRLHVLFDGSKGKGLSPEVWPEPLLLHGETVMCGYAGGLGPEVLPAELPRIRAAADPAPYWIDMESGIRTNNVFDLTKAEAVLASCH